MENSLFRVQVNSGRKSGASHPIPLGELSIGTTLDSQFFIGCADMWHQLLRATASSDLRSASPSRDALPEQLMQVVLTYDLTGITLRVEQGFADVGQQRLLPGDSCSVTVPMVVRVGASELEFVAEDRPVDTSKLKRIYTGPLTSETRAYPENLVRRNNASRGGFKFPQWLDGKAANAGLTALAVAGLSLAILNKPSATPAPDTEFSQEIASENSSSIPQEITPEITPETTQADKSMVSDPPVVEVHNGRIYNERIVAIVSSNPAFLMTESGQRYNLGAVVDKGFRISQIDQNAIEFTRGSETQSHKF